MEKQRLRFNVYDDLVLLKEVLKHNPFENVWKWSEIKDTVSSVTGKDFSLRCIKDHLNLLLDIYLKDNGEKIRRMSKETEGIERERLIQQSLVIFKASKKIKPKSGGSNENPKQNIIWVREGNSDDNNLTESRNFGLENCTTLNKDSSSTQDITITETIEIDDSVKTEFVAEGCESISDPNVISIVENNMQDDLITYDQAYSTSSEPNTTSKRQKETLKWIQNKKHKSKNKDYDLSKRRLRLEERKLDLEIQKFDLDKREREAKLSLEIEEKKHWMKIVENQQNMIMSLFQTFNNNNNNKNN